MERQSSSFLATMIERAKEELEKLETQHPNRFEYLKLELKSFISLSNHHALLSQQWCHHTHHLEPLPSTSAAATEASTSRVKRKRRPPQYPVSRKRAPPEEKEKKGLDRLVQKEEKRMMMTKKKNVTEKDMEFDRVDVALERARACIQKIQDLKVQFSIC